jgi:hypothetical protein
MEIWPATRGAKHFSLAQKRQRRVARLGKLPGKLDRTRAQK